MSASNTGAVAVVTGANRGLGFETAKQLAERGYSVVMTARNEGKAHAAAERLSTIGLDVVGHTLEVDNPDSVATLGGFLRRRGRVDVLVNNAGVFLDSRGPTETLGASVTQLSLDVLGKTMETNLYGPLLISQEVLPIMKEQNHGRIVNLSSGMGQLDDMGGMFAAYRMSKTALNALTRILAAESADWDIKVNAVCPGWVRTDMGGESATRSPEEAAKGIVWAATLETNGPSGGFFRDGQTIPW